MKTKSMFVIIMIILIPQILSAQLIRNSGVKAAFTSSGIYNEILNERFSRRAGISLAVFAEVFNTPVFSILLQAEYAQRGFLEEQAETNESGDFIQTVKANTRLDYLSFPILAKLRYSKGLYVPYIFFGPRLDFLLNKRNGEFRFTIATAKSEVADFYDNFVFGSTFGAGIELPKISSLRSILEIRYNLDFSDSYSSLDFNKVRNNSFDLWLGILF